MRRYIDLMESSSPSFGKWWDDGSTIRLFHGTSSAFQNDILEKGLSPPREDLRSYALDVLREYIPEKEWTSDLLNSVDDHAVRMMGGRRGDRGPVLYFLTAPPILYARSYARLGGEIASDVYTCACLFRSEQSGDDTWFRKGLNPPLQPRFPDAHGVIVEVEVPKDWCIFNQPLEGLKSRLTKAWNDGAEWTRQDANSLEELFDETFDGAEVRIGRTIPPEIIRSIKSVDEYTG